MSDKVGEVAASGGSNPAATGPGSGGAGATGGGQAVPDAETLMGGSGSLGDTSGVDDAGLSLADNTATSLEEEGGTTGTPQVAPSGGGDSGDVPTGGLSRTGTIGGAPTGAA